MTFLDSNVAFDAGVGQLPGDGKEIERRHGPHGVCFKVGPDHPGRHLMNVQATARGTTLPGTPIMPHCAATAFFRRR